MTEMNKPFTRCPHCGTTDADRSVLSSLDNLLRSHLELCTELRQIGRQLLHFEQQDGTPGQKSRSLDRMRKVLRRAENIRRSLKTTAVGADPEAFADGANVTLPSDPDFNAPEPSDIESGATDTVENPKNKGRVARSRAQRVINFPAAK